jgi:hypothetical protein
VKTILCCLCLLACAAVAVAAQGGGKKGKGRPDLSGTWQLDRSKSEFGMFGERPVAHAEVTLAIEHRDPELKIGRTLRVRGREETAQLAYHTDGRGESNPGLFGVALVASKTLWEGERVVARTRLKRKGLRGDADLELTEKWWLSGDGKTLSYTSVLRGEFGESAVKLVYRRGA